VRPTVPKGFVDSSRVPGKPLVSCRFLPSAPFSEGLLVNGPPLFLSQEKADHSGKLLVSTTKANRASAHNPVYPVPRWLLVPRHAPSQFWALSLPLSPFEGMSYVLSLSKRVMPTPLIHRIPGPRSFLERETDVLVCFDRRRETEPSFSPLWPRSISILWITTVPSCTYVPPSFLERTLGPESLLLFVPFHVIGDDCYLAASSSTLPPCDPSSFLY